MRNGMFAGIAVRDCFFLRLFSIFSLAGNGLSEVSQCVITEKCCLPCCSACIAACCVCPVALALLLAVFVLRLLFGVFGFRHSGDTTHARRQRAAGRAGRRAQWEVWYFDHA